MFQKNSIKKAYKNFLGAIKKSPKNLFLNIHKEFLIINSSAKAENMHRIQEGCKRPKNFFKNFPNR